MLLSNQSIQLKKSIDDIWPVAGKRVLLRVDFNVPVHNGVIDDDFRIRSAVPTIRRIIDQGGMCILISHLGRPVGVDYESVKQRTSKQQAPIRAAGARGKTAFFSTLNGEAKAQILSWSSQSGKAASLSTQAGNGKTAVFARLSDDEKRALLTRFFSENTDEIFPQLHSSPGYEEELSLQVVAIRLAELLDQQVYFAHDCLSAKHDVEKLRCGEVMLLENARFYSNEDAENPEKRKAMASILCSYGDIYVNDAFGVAHRDSATTTGIPRLLEQGAAGYLMEREISYFAKVLNHPARPLVAIVGGASLTRKVDVLLNMLDRIDSLIVGGSMAYSFLKAKGHHIGGSKCEEGSLEVAQRVLTVAKEQQVEVYLPLDHVYVYGSSDAEVPLTTTGVDIPDGASAQDIGPRTIQKFAEVLESAKSVIWNGPLGMFESPNFSMGTFSIARLVGHFTSTRGLISIVGGADTASAVIKSGESARFSHISTGGITSLELLEGKVLPAVAALDNKE